jgi:peptidoglycan/LPS O-acetylase OafA/YrhL
MTPPASPAVAPTAPAAGRIHFKGLDSLRFLAAFFVVLDHIPLDQESVGLPHPSYGALFFRGSFAVCFFFALSGFLITYLLLDERRRTGDISIRSFYLRRVCRIWPLYFAVIALGLVVYNLLLPRLGISHPVHYSLFTALALYSLLLPNLMNSLYTVGGILNPTWSIGVEEQFYLLWAPAVKRLRDRLPLLCWTVFAVSLALSCAAHYDVFGAREGKHFVEQLKFHYMAAGALCAWALMHRREALLAWPIFSRKTVQAVLLVLLLDLYLTNFLPWGWLGEELAQLALYAWLILTVAARPGGSVVRPGNRILEHLGRISYGIYMLHMPAIYVTSEIFRLTSWWHGRLALYCAAFYLLAFGLTWLLAELSYRFYELPFLRLKDRRFTVIRTDSGPPATR